MLVHLIDDRDAASVRRSGIKGSTATVDAGGTRVEIHRAVFAMPVLPNFFASHQWLRELKRRGMRTIAAVHFRVRADAMVWVGRYNSEHRLVPLGHAAGLIMREPDPRGWQIIVPDHVAAKAIHAIREVPQVVGWRYFPESHEKGPWKCCCDFCLRGLRGEIKSKKLAIKLVTAADADHTNFETRAEALRNRAGRDKARKSRKT